MSSPRPTLRPPSGEDKEYFEVRSSSIILFKVFEEPGGRATRIQRAWEDLHNLHFQETFFVLFHAISYTFLSALIK